ncbi:MAG TPA: alpha/beta hydrolase [Chitinophagales bacterium]|nr:alpha/beta hydrolase [Chitinophagales bacterium]
MINSKFKIQKILLAAMMLSVFVVFYACKKVEDKIRTDTSKTASTNKKGNSSSDRVGAPIDSLEYYSNLFSPTGAVKDFIKQGGVLPITKYVKDYRDLLYQKNIGNGSFPYVCSNGIVVLGYPGAVCPGGGTGSKLNLNNSSGLDCPTYILDPYGNKIYAFSMYDDKDSRQFYYVYLPDNFNANSPIVVLIHGGGWFSGPNPDNTNGWQLPFSFTPSQTNFVKDLLSDSFVVVVPLYRLSRYGNTEPEITSNPVICQDQLNDIDSAIVNVRRNFPSCLGINANSIQVVGESAGGHLALMWAYTKTTVPSAYIKSVVDMYAPTNMQQYGNYLMNILNTFVCGSIFWPFNNFFPWYFPIPDLTNPLETYNTTVFDCKAQGYANSRVLQSYKMIKSIVAISPITTPLTSTDLANVSPCFSLVSSRVIPTFVMHGKNDNLVPYANSTSTMDTKLTNTGGLLFNFTSSAGSVPTSYTSSLKHGIKQYDNANHGWATTDNNPITHNFSQTILYNLVHADARKWLNGHK